MNWKDLLQPTVEYITVPWIGGREIRARGRAWDIIGRSPWEHGWYTFELHGRTAKVAGVRVDPIEPFLYEEIGWLAGDFFACDILVNLRGHVSVNNVTLKLPRIYLIEEGLERFARVRVGQITVDSPRVFAGIAMPLGPEDDVARAFQDRLPNVDHIKDVSPGLDLAFRMAVRQRDEDDARRAAIEAKRREEEAKRVLEERRQGLIKQLGDGAGRRALAKIDFRTAAQAALSIGGAELLDWRKAHDEFVVTYRLDGRRFQCTCDENLQICSAGICLVDHVTGRADDRLLTLESLPAVVRQAEREGKLVVFRNV